MKAKTNYVQQNTTLIFWGTIELQGKLKLSYRVIKEDASVPMNC